MTKAIVLISGNGSNLQAFIDGVQQGYLPLSIELVISNKPDVYGLQRASEAGISNCVVNHHDYASRQSFDQALIEKIDSIQPDIIILAGFMRILTEEFVDHYCGKLVNIHPSLLPKFPGTNTHQRALDAKESWHGATVHFVVNEVDAGPIIAQGQFKVNEQDSVESLKLKTHQVEHKLYPYAIKWLAQKQLKMSDGKVIITDNNATQDKIKQWQTFDF